MKLFLVDAYALIYRSYYAFIKNPQINSKGVNTSAIYGFINSMKDVMRRENPSHLAIAFDPSGPTFRHEAYEAYKAQREETPEVIRQSVPIIKEIIKAYHIPMLEVPHYEADDVIGTVSKMAEKEGFDVYMMTPDKDYGQLVADHIYMYRPKYGGGYEVLGVPEILEKYSIASTEQVIDLLGLMGDSSDNIPGCPGIGEKTAVKLLNEYGTIENLLAKSSELKGALKNKIVENAEQIKFSKFLATIKTDVPVTFDAKACLREEPDRKRLTELYEELEFRKFREELTEENNEGKAKTGPIQGSLFAEFASAGTGTPENSILADIKTTNHKYYLTDSEEKQAELVAIIKREKKCAFDTETDNIEPTRAKLVGMSFAIKEHEAWYVPVPEEESEAQAVVGRFAEILENDQIEKIGQNIKFDMIVMRRQGIKIAGKIFDTMLAHYLLNPEIKHNMDYLAERYLNYKTIHIEELIGQKGRGQKTMRDIPVEEIYEYAAEDADITLQLYHFFQPKLKEANVEKLFGEIEMPLVFVLADMETTGVKIDTNVLSELSKEMTDTMNRIEKDVHEMAGEDFNLNSTQQVGNILYNKLSLGENIKKTKTGGQSTNEEALLKIRSKHPIVEKILEYRTYKKLLGTYIDALPKLINPETGKIHTSYNQAVTATGRLSSTNPNLQNIPVREDLGREIRKAFIPENDQCVYFSADYSQIELRIMAHLSGDENMIAAFRSGADIHAATAAKIFNVSLDEVSKEMRRKAKTANFGIIYGISVFGLAERLGIPRSEAKELIDGYFQTYHRIKEYMNESIEKAKKEGYVETLFHRKRYLPDINSHNSVVRGYAERNAINAPIQGSAADIIKLAMNHIFGRFEKERLRSKMILQVHDELNFNVYNEELEEVKTIVIDEMDHVVDLKVPLIADYGVGANWLEAH